MEATDTTMRYGMQPGVKRGETVSLTEAEKGGKNEEAEIIKRVSPIAWRHINLYGRFEFQREHTIINIDEMIKALTHESTWQKLKTPLAVE